MENERAKHEFLGFPRVIVNVRGKHYQGYYHHVLYSQSQGGERHWSIYFKKSVADRLAKKFAPDIEFDPVLDCYFVDGKKMPSKMTLWTIDGYCDLYCLSGIVQKFGLNTKTIQESYSDSENWGDR